MAKITKRMKIALFAGAVLGLAVPVTASGEEVETTARNSPGDTKSTPYSPSATGTTHLVSLADDEQQGNAASGIEVH